MSSALSRVARPFSKNEHGGSACRFLAALLLLSATASAADPATPFFVGNHDRVVFYGDSITDTEWYPTLVETYVLTRFPQWRNEFSNRGVSGDNSRSIARFERDVLAQRPQAVVYMMGYNDGGYTVLRSDALTNFLGNVERSVALAREQDPRMRILLASAPVNETVVSDDPRWVSPDSYPYTLLMLGQEEGRLAARLGTGFADIARLYGQTMGLGQVLARNAFALSRDGVHPQQEGQTFLAFHMLRGMGAGAPLARTEIDAAKARVVSSEQCQATDLHCTNGVVSFTRHCDSLPYPTPAVARPFSFLVQLDDVLNRDLVVVHGLTAPSYVLSVDGRRVAEAPAAAIEDGLNLSRYPDTPMYEQALAVLDAVRRKDLLEMAYWRKFIVPGKADGAGNALPAADAATRAEMDAARREIANAAQACYALNAPRPHVITLAPSQTALGRYEELVNHPLNRSHLKISMTPMRVDWNTMAPMDHDVTFTIVNANPTAKSGVIRWAAGAGWTIAPPEAPFTVEPMQTQTARFTIVCAPGTPLLPLPSVTVRWPWTRDWAYPMSIRRELNVRPVLTIKRSTVKVVLDGQLDDWKDATTFTLDDEHYVDPPVAGKKALWGGSADLSARVLMKWDDDALYLAAEVRDSEHIQNQSEMMMWSQDMLHVAALMPETGKPDGRYEFGFGAYADRDAVAKYMNSAANAAGPDIGFKSRLDKDRGVCIYEVVIPWSRLPPFTPQPGKTFRFTLAVSDADSQPGKGFNFLEWTPGINYGKDPAEMAHIVLGSP